MQYIGFNLAGKEYTIPLLKVREIINIPPITKMPQSPPHIEGISNLRGKVIPIVNLRRLMNLNGNHNPDKVMVLSDGKVDFGILVDGITGVINIEESAIEPAENILKGENVSFFTGIAKLPDRIIGLFDTEKLFTFGDMSLFEGYTNIKEGAEETVKTELTKTRVEEVKGLGSLKEFTEKMGIDTSDPRYVIFTDLLNFMDAVANQDYKGAENAIQNIMKKGQSGLYDEVGKITRKLHDSLTSFKESIDPKLKEVAIIEVPKAVDSLQFVIDKTEEAANKTLGVIEKYILSMDELASHIRNIKEPESSATYLRGFKNRLEDDLTEILTAQSFQDITGQTLKKVIKLIRDIEEELIRLITNFGVKIEQGVKTETVSTNVSQNDVDNLLKEFGF
ncbi:MAG: protein phosphatase CheZ [Nitrospirae bacterium]|nr:protein phosphatase CheZ [Nitrospirota bacterium]